jgi:uncharacterized protein
MAIQRPPLKLDIQAFTQSTGALEGSDLLQNYERLVVDLYGLKPDSLLKWRAHGFLRDGVGGQAQPWLHIEVKTRLPLQCQRCLGPCEEVVQLDREFRFVATEKQAEAEDDTSEEDVLVTSKQFDLRGLLEDEILMSMPLVPKHARCPDPVKLAVQDEGFEAVAEAKKKPFADLKGLLTQKLTPKD